jgi:predicted enzyme related to lactoylglutathione lyase
MSRAVQPIILTLDLAGLLHFYATLFGAVETSRYPSEGRPFYVGLRIGDSELGLVANEEEVATTSVQRMLLSVEVQDADALLDRVEPLGGTALGAANDMPWGQRVAHIRDPDGNTVNLTQAI